MYNEFNKPYDYNNYPQRPQLNHYAFVNGIEGAKSFQIAPNQTMLLMDSESPIIYMKTANGLGQSNLKYFKMTEISENEVRNFNNDNNPYALKTDLKVLENKFDEILAKLNMPKE